jgi:septum formation protein
VTGSVRFILASASPARRRLLAAAGIAAEVQISRVDEGVAAHGLTVPTDVAAALAAAKARDVAGRLAPRAARVFLLGCDSVLEMPEVPQLAGLALGKPADPAQAVARWQLMRGGEGLLHTGHCLLEITGERTREQSAVATTRVRFAEPSTAEIEAYVATGEPLRVAGGFTLDGLGGAFVRGVVGDPANVIGLSLPLLRDLMGRAGVPWPALWTSSSD